MDIDLTFWFRMLNVALSVFVVSLCFLKLIWYDKDRALRMRILSLALLSVASAWMAYDLRYDDFHPRIPLMIVGLAAAAYGLHHMPTDEHKETPRLKN